MGKKPNWFVRVLIILLSLLLAAMIIYKYFMQSGIPIIDSGLITILILLIIVILSESFDNFSFGQLLTLQRNKTIVEKEKNKLSQENTVLREQLINISTSLNQNQTSNNIFGVSDEMLQKMFVKQATPEEVELNEIENNEEKEEREKPKRLNRREIESYAMSQYMNSNKIDETYLIKEAKLVTEFHGIDPISNIQPIFDGYINSEINESFIEVRLNHMHSFMFRERLYLMLNKIYLYNKISNNNTRLILILINIEDENDNRGEKNLNYYKEYFEPAILKGLLHITQLSISKEESTKFYDK